MKLTLITACYNAEKMIGGQLRVRSTRVWTRFMGTFVLCADFELVMRFMWKERIRTRYLPRCSIFKLKGSQTDKFLV